MWWEILGIYYTFNGLLLAYLVYEDKALRDDAKQVIDNIISDYVIVSKPSKPSDFPIELDEIR